MNVQKYMKIVLLTLLICATVLVALFASVHVMNRDGAGVFAPSGQGKQINILLMATDKGGLLTDTIMIASLDKERNMLNLLSIPRDTKITINNGPQKINAAYAYGKKGKRHELVIEKINTLVDLPIHHYAVVNPQGFVALIDMLGGVEIDVPQRMKYKDPEQNLYIDLYPGLQVLDGDKAEQFCRFRSGYPDQDLGRQRAQQQFVKALVEQKLKFKYLLQAPQLFQEAMKYVETDISAGDFAALLPAIKAFKTENIHTYQLPGEGGAYFICDKAATKKLIDEVFLNKLPRQ